MESGALSREQVIDCLKYEGHVPKNLHVGHSPNLIVVEKKREENGVVHLVAKPKPLKVQQFPI
jgi:hypothetical protein